MDHQLRYAANCSLLFTEAPLIERPAAAAAAGFAAAHLVASLRAQGDGGLDPSALLRGVGRLSGQKVSGE